MAQARIYQPGKNAMQSGRGNTKHWVLEFEPTERRKADPVVGWIGSGDTLSQLHMKFDSKEAAVSYAEREGLAYTVEEPKKRRLVPKVYADNFAHSKLQ